MSATPQLPPVAKLEQKTVVDMVTKGKRIDERGLESYRPIQIQVGLIKKANGSAQVYLGKSKVLCGIKIETGEPFPDTPDEGVLTVNAELAPIASQSFEMGPPSEAAIELSRVVDRGIRESKAVDLKSLVLQKGKKVQVDCLGLSYSPVNDSREFNGSFARWTHLEGWRCNRDQFRIHSQDPFVGGVWEWFAGLDLDAAKNF